MCEAPMIEQSQKEKREAEEQMILEVLFITLRQEIPILVVIM